MRRWLVLIAVAVGIAGIITHRMTRPYWWDAMPPEMYFTQQGSWNAWRNTSSILFGLDEPSLIRVPVAASHLRLTALGMYETRPAVVRVDLGAPGAGRLTAKLADGRTWLSAAGRRQVTTRALTKTEVDDLVRQLSVLQACVPETERLGMHGPYWVFEVVSPEGRCVVAQAYPHPDIWNTLGRSLFEMSGSIFQDHIVMEAMDPVVWPD